jgi:hypothetical protein
MGARTNTFRWIGIGVLVPVGVLVVLVSIVGVRTIRPLSNAREDMDQLELELGEAARDIPLSDGSIPATRMELFLRLRAELFDACADYGPMQRAFGTVDSLDTRPDVGWDDVGEVSWVLGGAAFEITPFVARYFERRNAALLAVRMGLEEYAYIYALAYRDQLLASETRRQIFSDGGANSPGASEILRGCLERQLERGARDPGSLRDEVGRMVSDDARLPWQDGAPVTITASVEAWRDRLDANFCAVTAGLEMEVNADRAIRLALE